MIVDYYSNDGGLDTEVFLEKCQTVAEQLDVIIVKVISRSNSRHVPPLGCNIIRVELEGTEEACAKFIAAIPRVTSD